MLWDPSIFVYWGMNRLGSPLTTQGMVQLRVFSTHSLLVEAANKHGVCTNAVALSLKKKLSMSQHPGSIKPCLVWRGVPMKEVDATQVVGVSGLLDPSRSEFGA